LNKDMVTPTDLNSTPPSTTLTTSDDVALEPVDPLDFQSAIWYLVFDVIMAVGPSAVFFAYYRPVFETWTGGQNTYFKVVHYILWIGNLAIYGVPAVFGGFTWLWNAYVTAGYMAWTQYLVVWGGSVLQALNFVLLMVAAFTYTEVTDVGASNLDTEFIEFAIWTIVTGGIYAGYWLLNDYFLTYYVIEEIDHDIISEEEAEAIL